jgi:hypothetical protein
MTVQISQRGEQYLKTAETLLHAAQTMIDRAIAGKLQAFADDYQQRAEKASHVDAAKALARSAANAEGEWDRHDGQLHSRPCDERLAAPLSQGRPRPGEV